MMNKDESVRSTRREEAKNANRDPITGAPGAHPVGVGIGATGGGVAGAAIGAAVAGPVGAVIGAGVGAVAGGLAGKAGGEEVNPTVEDAYWRGNYHNRPYVKSGASYDIYEPAYRYGWESRSRHVGKKFDELEGDLERDWTRQRGDSSLNWSDAREAVRDAWHRDRRQDQSRKS